MAAEGSAGLIHSLIDRLANEYAGEPFRAEIAEAKEDFFNRAGKVFEDDAELFEGRMASFLEWYVLERPLQGGLTPALRALQKANEDPVDQGASPAMRKALAALATSHRSLFDLAAVVGDTVELEDLLGGARFKVVERRSTVGFEAGDLVEARLVWDGERVVFTKTLLFHPRDAREEALKSVDEALARGTPRVEIMFALSRMHVRWHRHNHLNAARVYRGGS